MYKCYSDMYGNMPCDNGCLCDRCLYEDVVIVPFPNIEMALGYFHERGMDVGLDDLFEDVEDDEEVE